MSVDHPITPAVRVLRDAGAPFEAHLYAYEEKGGTERSAEALGVDEHVVIKTLIFETDTKAPLVVLMHGDRSVSAKQLARHLGVKTIAPCAPETAHRHTGYLVGGTSPFGLRKKMPIYAERTIFNIDRIYINGGKRGFLVSLATADLRRVLAPELVEVAV